MRRPVQLSRCTSTAACLHWIVFLSSDMVISCDIMLDGGTARQVGRGHPIEIGSRARHGTPRGKKKPWTRSCM